MQNASGPLNSAAGLNDLQTRGGAFVDDVINSVNDYCADGFDAFEECVRREDFTRDVATRQATIQGVENFYQKLSQSVNTHLEDWEKLVHAACFKVPEGLVEPPQAQAPGREQAGGAAATEEAGLVDEGLVQLRQSLAAVTAESASLRRDLRSLDCELRRFQGRAQQIRTTLRPPGLEQAQAAADAASIVAAAAKLQPLLERAEELTRASTSALFLLPQKRPNGDGAPLRHAVGAPTVAVVAGVEGAGVEDLAQLNKRFRC